MFQCEELLQGITYECVRGTTDKQIGEVVYDSRKLKKDCLFICICGYNVDGHDFAREAVEKGAAVLVVQRDRRYGGPGGRHPLCYGFYLGGLFRPPCRQAESDRDNRN